MAAFQKRELGKALLHPNALLQRSGLQYLAAVLQRFSKTLSGVATTAAAVASSSAGQVTRVEGAAAAAVHQLLPDFHLLLNLRTR
jgi:hypothetical protein